MPTIPTMNESQRISQGGVSPFQNAKDARLAGENLQLLGRSISSLANDLSQTHKEDTFTRGMLIKQAEAQAKLSAETFMSMNRKTNTEDDGSNLVDNYNKFMVEEAAKHQQSVPEAFRGYTGMAFQTASLTSTGEVLKEKMNKNSTFQIAMIDKSTSSLINGVNVSPSSYDKAKIDSAQIIIAATEAGKLSKESLFDNLKNNDKKLAEAQVNGYMSLPRNSLDMANFTLAEEALTRHKDKFTPEEYEKKTISMQNAKYTKIERIMKVEDQAEKKVKDLNQAKEEAEITKMTVDMFRTQSDPTKLQILKTQFQDKMYSGRYKDARPAAFAALKLSEEQQGAAMSFEISRDLGKSPTMESVAQMRDRVALAAANDGMKPAVAEYWIKRLDGMKEGLKKDPRHAEKVRSLHTLIRMVHGAGPLDVVSNMNGESVHNATVSTYKMEELLGQGVDPDVIKLVLLKRFGMSKSITGQPVRFPIAGMTGNVLDSTEKLQIEKDMLYNGLDKGTINSKQFRDSMKEVKRIEDRLESEKTLLDRQAEHLGDSPLVPAKQIGVPLRR